MPVKATYTPKQTQQNFPKQIIIYMCIQVELEENQQTK